MHCKDAALVLRVAVTVHRMTFSYHIYYMKGNNINCTLILCMLLLSWEKSFQIILKSCQLY